MDVKLLVGIHVGDVKDATGTEGVIGGAGQVDSARGVWRQTAQPDRQIVPVPVSPAGSRVMAGVGLGVGVS